MSPAPPKTRKRRLRNGAHKRSILVENRAAPEPMKAVDRAWLEMDEPHNPMVVSSIMEFDHVADPQQLARELGRRLCSERRFRQRVIESADGYAWVEDDDLHFGYHVQLRPLEGPLTAAIAAELGHPLDRALPLWRLCLFIGRGGRVTALFRAHHAIADGVALMRLLLQLADETPGGRRAVTPTVIARRHGPLAGFIQRLESVNSLMENLTAQIVEDLRYPGRFSRQVGEFRSKLAAIGRALTLPDDNPKRLRAATCGRRAVAWTANLPFAAVREFAHAQHVTINDVFLTALAGAFGAWLRKADGHLSEQQNLRVSIPVNLRAGDDDMLGNSFGLVLLDLPVGLEGWHARLDVIADRMASLKESPEASAVLLALAAAGRLPAAAERKLVRLVGGKAAAVVSNLPGPRHLLHVDGARLRNMVFWPPQTAGIGIGVSLLSYAGHITVGVSADCAQIAHPQQLIDAFRAELETMLGRRFDADPVRPSTHRAARPAQGDNHAQA